MIRRLIIKNALHGLKKPLVERMQMVLSLSLKCMCHQTFLQLSQCTSEMKLLVGGFSEELVPECPPPSDLDEPYEAKSPIKTPPHAALHELDTDDEADDKSPVTGLGAVASIAFDAVASLPQEDVKSMFQGSFDQGGQTGCLGAAAAPEKKPPKHGKGKHNHSGKDVLFEFACAKDSNLGKVGHENVLRVIRLCKEDINLEDPHSIEQLIAQVGALEGCSIHGSIECRPWSQWQHLNRAKYPRLAAKIEQVLLW
jgi:hypothetical protein